MIDPGTIRVQILQARADEPGCAALAVARAQRDQVAVIAAGQGVEALLVCPAPDEIAEEGIDLIVAARFEAGLDGDTIFWRQLDLASELDHALRVGTLVLDLDGPLDPFLGRIAPLLSAPYHDELSRRHGAPAEAAL